MIPFTDEELMPVVSKILDKVRPMLVQDGGDMKLLAIKNGRVFIQFQGACNGCASSDVTLKFGVERQLRIDIHPEMEVVNVPVGSEIDEIRN
ncbi:MAG: NifU family protein [Campylobacteraceae bacterium]|jgi:Fe-S cluster biogenesis protein NfuA|nr:NifU family protein [Campylobacteraceae bacterium]